MSNCLEKAAPNLLASLLELRWTAAARIQQDDIISVELKKYRHRLAFDDASGWGRVLITAVERQALHSHCGLEALQPALDELESMNWQELGPPMERLDLLLGMMRDWKLFYRSHLPTAWKQFLQECFIADQHTNERRMGNIVAEIASNPLAALNDLGYLYKQHTIAAYILFDHIERYCLSKGVDIAGKLEVPEQFVMTDRLRKILNWQYEGARDNKHALLEYCLAESVSLAAICELLHPGCVPRDSLESLMRTERQVHYVYAAWRAFWKEIEPSEQ